MGMCVCVGVCVMCGGCGRLVETSKMESISKIDEVECMHLNTISIMLTPFATYKHDLPVGRHDYRNHRAIDDIDIDGFESINIFSATNLKPIKRGS